MNYIMAKPEFLKYMIIFALIPLVLSIGITPAFAVESPYQQVKNGVAARDVVCNSDLSLMIRPNDKPACIQSGSVEQLGILGWEFVEPEIETMEDEPEQYTVDLEESVGMTGS